MKTYTIPLLSLSVSLITHASVPVFHNNGLIRLDDYPLCGVIHSNMPPPGISNPDYQNSGMMSVVSCGYDDMGIWQTIPLHIHYKYNGFQYTVTILAAWNPQTLNWEYDLNLPAVNTYFTHSDVEYDFYVALSTGTFYFNL